MTDSPRRDGSEPTQPLGNGYSGYPGTDPAYASQAPYGQAYRAPGAMNPTEQLPAYAPYGYDPYSPYTTGQHGQGGPPPPPGGPRTPRWLWLVAGVAVVVVIALIIALVIVNSSQQDTLVAPPPSAPEPTLSTPTTTAPTTTPRPTPTTTPSPAPIVPAPTTTAPTESATPGATDTVVYTVEGRGRAINLTYVADGPVMQTEFNVMLPWSKEVELPRPATGSASISILNVGREVTCTVTVNGVVVQQSSGTGMTICVGSR
ncbi:MAG: hypothetical protein JST91_28120 [Actinobacteria bacterium]|nr:hypothetical protein [Actinomycetota bacterium]